MIPESLAAKREYDRKYSREYHLAHREECRQASRSYSLTHREERQDYNRRYYAAHRERILKWQRKYSAARRNRLRDYARDQRHGVGVWELVMAKYGGKCVDCGEPATVVHHLDGQGATHRTPNHAIENQVPLCVSCHQKHHETQLYNQRVVSLTCEHCAVTYQVLPSRARLHNAKRRRRFCSKSCASAHRGPSARLAQKEAA